MARRREQAKSSLRFVGRSLYAGAVLSGVRYLTPDFAGVYQSPVDKIAAGILMKVTKKGPGMEFIHVAVAEAFSTALDTTILPLLQGLAKGSPLVSRNGNGGGGLMNAAAARAN